MIGLDLDTCDTRAPAEELVKVESFYFKVLGPPGSALQGYVDTYTFERTTQNQSNVGIDWLQLGNDFAFYGGIEFGFILDQSVDIALREGRGRYEGPKEFLRKQTNLKSISKFTKGISLGFTALSVGVSFAEFAASDQSGADYARLVGAGVIIGTNFIPYVGPLISTSLAIGDATGQFESFYDGFDNALYRSMFFNSLLSGGRSTVGPFKQ
ncbi:MAG: hypothetical protein OEY56_05295 [Cyclobacteriaceae bacterium]|nr:hypothetical protein [Cyclobacteriaceae bacterium]